MRRQTRAALIVPARPGGVVPRSLGQWASNKTVRFVAHVDLPKAGAYYQETAIGPTTASNGSGVHWGRDVPSACALHRRLRRRGRPRTREHSNRLEGYPLNRKRRAPLRIVHSANAGLALANCTLPGTPGALDATVPAEALSRVSARPAASAAGPCRWMCCSVPARTAPLLVTSS